jgi:glutamyl-tRNA synthetase
MRFMELFNIQVEKSQKDLVQAVFHSESYEEAKRLGAPLIHWIPMNSGVPCEVVMPDASAANGVAEEACETLSPNEVVQFERFGFVRVDVVNEKLTVYFAHR